MPGLTAIPYDTHSLYRLIFSKLKLTAFNTWLFQTRDYPFHSKFLLVISRRKKVSSFF